MKLLKFALGFASLSCAFADDSAQQKMEDAYAKTKSGIIGETTRIVDGFPPIYYKGDKCANHLLFSSANTYPTVSVICLNTGPQRDHSCTFSWYASEKGDSNELEASFYAADLVKIEGEWIVSTSRAYREQKSPSVAYQVLAQAIQQRVDTDCDKDFSAHFETTTKRDQDMAQALPTFDQCHLREIRSGALLSSNVKCYRNNSPKICEFSLSFYSQYKEFKQSGDIYVIDNNQQNDLAYRDLHSLAREEKEVKTLSSGEQVYSEVNTFANAWFAKNCKP